MVNFHLSFVIFQISNYNFLLDPGTHVGYGYCEAGFSSSGTTEPSDDNPLFVFGSPGAIRFSGALFTVDAEQNVKQTLRLRSGLSSSSYMGMYLRRVNFMCDVKI